MASNNYVEGTTKSISLIVPIKNEEESILELSSQIMTAFEAFQGNWECIWVDDGSTDASWEVISKLGIPHFGVRLSRNFGQSAAIMAGLNCAKYDVIGTIDGDLQNDPNEIVLMFAKLSNEVDLVQGYRDRRQDKFWSRKVPSYFANVIARRLSGIGLRDLGCSSRVFRKSLISGVNVLGEMHRVFGLYLIEAGAKVIEVPTIHRPRMHGTSKYGLNRTLKFIADLILLTTLRTLYSKPLYLFIKLSLITLVTAIALFLSAFVLRILEVKDYVDGSLIAGSLVLFSTSVIILGLGLIAELIIRILVSLNREFHYIIKAKHNY